MDYLHAIEKKEKDVKNPKDLIMLRVKVKPSLKEV